MLVKPRRRNGLCVTKTICRSPLPPDEHPLRYRDLDYLADVGIHLAGISLTVLNLSNTPAAVIRGREAIY
jgi:hypothetical protein